ncbi:MAG: right-handed parallel beta-helix repeat-containing protein [Bacteroidota bacterium]
MRALLVACLLLAAAPVAAQLAGTYTVGGAAPDYATPQDAADALATFGVSGNAVFQIRPGTYDGGLDLDAIPGASEAARVRFEAANTANPPVLRRPAATAASNYVVRLDGADWVTLRDLELVAAAPSPTGRLVVLASDASNVTVRRCTLTGHAAPGSDAGSLIWTDATSVHDAFTLDQSTLTDGWRGLDLDSPPLDEPIGLMVSDNTLRGQEEDGLRVRGDGRVEGNDVADDASAVSSYQAITTLGGPSGIEVVGNTVEVAFGLNGINGLSGTSLIANNFVAMRRGVASAAGIYAISGSRVIHNTVRAEGQASALLLPPAGTGIVEIRNNILVVNGTGTAIKDTGTSSIGVSDDNLLFTSQAPLVEWDGATYATLADWQAAGFDAGSISQTTDFVFVSTSAGGWDLHLDGASLTDLSLVAPPVADVTTDADGDARDPYNPKRGADEGTPLPPLDDADTASGFYTVGGTTPDFPEADEALDALATRGMKGAVSLRIRAGTYADVRESLRRTIRVGPAETDPASAPLLIRAANPAAPPTLVSGATDTFNWALRLRGLDHVTLRDLVFDASGAGAASRILVLNEGADGGGVDDLTVEGCTFLGSTVVGLSNARALLFSEDRFHDRLTVTGSTFTDGWIGIDLLSGDLPDAYQEVTISDNTFGGAASRGINIEGASGIEISGNTLTSAQSSPIGLFLSDGTGVTVTGNEMNLTAASGTGIYLQRLTADANGDALVANNLVRANQPVFVDDGSADLVHNTLYASGDQGTAVTARNGGTVTSLTNNILYSATGDPAVEVDADADLTTSDGNVLWTVGSGPLVQVGATTYAHLAAWQATGRGARSREFQPSFAAVGAGDLRLGAASDGDPRLAGLTGTGVTTDADGQARSAVNPYIGADERTALVPLAGTYRVGVAPPGSIPADFATLAEAVDAAHLLGVSAEVLFQLYDDLGPLPVTIRPFGGASATSRLRMVPLSAGRAFPYAAPDAASNGALVIDGADWVSLEAMGFDTSGGTAPYGRALTITGDVEGLRLAVPVFLGMTGQTDPEADLIVTEAATLTDFTVTDGQLTGGARGLRLRASGSTGTRIERLRVVGHSQDGIALRGHTAPVIEDVVVESTASVGSVTGLRLDGGTGGTVSGARVTMIGGFGTGLTVDDHDGTEAEPVTIVNTFLTSASAGLVVADAAHVRVVHTTVRAEGGSGALFETGGSSDLTLVNNVWVHAGSGRAVNLSAASVAAEGRFNALFTDGTVFATVGGVDYDDLGDYRAATGLGENATLPAAVAFVDGPGGDLHLTGTSEGDARLSGTPLADVTTDVDGDTRSATQPYRGADEAATPIPPGVQFLLTVALQAPYLNDGVDDGIADAMRTDLWDAGLVPAQQPYGDPAFDGTPLDYDGPEAVDLGAFVASVDWVIVELRETVDGPAVARSAVLVANGGAVNHPADGPVLRFPVAPGAYHVVVRHRNHLPLLSEAWPMAAMWSSDDGILRMERVANVVGGAAGGVEVEPGVVAMAAADGNADGLVTAPDFNRFSTASGAGTSGYVIADYTLDGLVTAPDFNLFSTNAAAGVASTVPED